MSLNRWNNWSGRQTSEPRHIVQPTNEAGFVAAIEQAVDAELPIRAVGASHSHSRVAATDGVLVTTDGWQGVVSTDNDTETAVVRAGTRIFQLGEPLHAAGLALRNQGDIDRQSVAGAIATGTHGTGPTLQNLSASVESVRLVLADGRIVDTDPSNEPVLFELARHSLGGVGLVTEVGLALRPAYRLHERLWKESPEPIFERIDELVAATRHFEFFWMPQLDVCAAKSLTETDAQPDPMPDTKLERIGWSHDIISTLRENLHTEMEYSVPAEAGPQCFMAVRALIGAEFGELEWPVEYRTVAADDLWISAASGRPTVTISVHQDISLDDQPLFDACESVFRSFDGRPHWGKSHSLTGAELADLYPRLGGWWTERDRWDPTGVFVTPELAALRP